MPTQAHTIGIPLNRISSASLLEALGLGTGEATRLKLEKGAPGLMLEAAGTRTLARAELADLTA